MTSFVFQGPAIGGPANGRELVSYSQIFTTLYPVQKPALNVTYIFAQQPTYSYGLFRYCAHKYGSYWFFLPLGETLENFLEKWRPPVQQDHWPAFIEQAIEALKGK